MDNTRQVPPCPDLAFSKTVYGISVSDLPSISDYTVVLFILIIIPGLIRGWLSFCHRLTLKPDRHYGSRAIFLSPAILFFMLMVPFSLYNQG